MNNQPVVLELREQDTSDGLKVANGEWETILNQPIDINDGDSIMIQQSFLDTATFPDGTITIPNDLSLRIQNYVYNNKWIGGELQDDPAIAPNVYGQWTPANGGGTSAILTEDANPFVLCTKLPSADAGDFKVAPEFRITAIGNRSGFNTHYGGYTVVLEYQAVGQTGAQRSYLNLDMPKQKNQKGNYYNFLIDITYRESVDIKVISPSTAKIERNGGRTSFPGKGEAAPAHGAWHPKIFTKIYPLKAGNYTPQQLCKTVNDQFQNNYGAGIIGAGVQNQGPWTASQFFRSSDGEAVNEGFSYAGNVFDTATLMNIDNINEGYSHLATYGPNALGPDQARNVWIGASQVQLSYDTDSEKFFWEYLHTPLYNGGEESVAVRYNTPGGGGQVKTTAGSLAMCYSNGGIIFQSLTAFEGILGGDNYNEVPFWNETLKFNIGRLYGPRYKMTAPMVGAPFNGDIKPYWTYLNIAQLQTPEEPTMAVGLTMTGGYIGNDNMVVKDGDLSSTDATDMSKIVPFFQCNPIRTLTAAVLPEGPSAGAIFGTFNPLFSTNTGTYTIDAFDRMFKTTDIRSHYLVEIDAKFQNNFLTNSTNIRSMSQIIGKYYSKGSFTESNSSGFVYTHTGPSLTLTSFKVKILYPNKELATDIGGDNTVYMSIVRNPNARQIEAQQLEDFVKENKAIEE